METKYENKIGLSENYYIESDSWLGASAIIVDESKKVCIVKNSEGDKKDQWVFPGGTREINETPTECLIREVSEEAQLEISNINFFIATDSIDISGAKKNKTAYLRYVCKAVSKPDFIPHKDGFETSERIFVEIDELPNYIKWLSSSGNGPQFMSLIKKTIANLE